MLFWIVANFIGFSKLTMLSGTASHEILVRNLAAVIESMNEELEQLNGE